jgi:hypothetical protein
MSLLAWLYVKMQPVLISLISSPRAQTMLLNKLREETDRQEAAAEERRAAAGAGGGAGVEGAAAAMDIDDAAGAGGQQRDGGGSGDQGGAERPGLRQQELVDWYMEAQINRWGLGALGEGCGVRVRGV